VFAWVKNKLHSVNCNIYTAKDRTLKLMAEPDNIQQVVDIDDDEEWFVDPHTSYNL